MFPATFVYAFDALYWGKIHDGEECNVNDDDIESVTAPLVREATTLR